MSRFDAVFFDFGGTLFSYRQLVRGGEGPPLFVQAAQRLGVEVDDKRSLGRAWMKASEAAFGTVGTKPYYLHRELFEETFRGFARALGGEADAAFIDWMYDAQRDGMLASLRLRDDCHETLAALKAEGLGLAIVSNIDDDYLHPMVEQTGLHEVLHAWTSSEEAQSCKPHAGIFEHALEKQGVAAERVLFVGDSPEHDIAGARPLGMTTVLIVEDEGQPMGQGHLTAAEPHHEIRSLSELLPIVRG